MTIKCSYAPKRRVQSNSTFTQEVERPVEKMQSNTVIEVQDSGDWITAIEFKKRAARALGNGKDLTLNLHNLSHLDASALQILLAIDEVQRRRESRVHPANLSSDLRLWFQHAGAIERFSIIERMPDEQ